MGVAERRIVWNKAAEKDFGSFPDDVKASFRMALEEARDGKHPVIADPYGHPLGAGYYKLKDDDTRRNTYRSVYCVRFKEAVYVLHVFQKKSKSGRADPPGEIDTAKARAKWAELQHALWERDQAESTRTQTGASSKKERGKR